MVRRLKRTCALLGAGSKSARSSPIARSYPRRRSRPPAKVDVPSAAPRNDGPSPPTAARGAARSRAIDEAPTESAEYGAAHALHHARIRCKFRRRRPFPQATFTPSAPVRRRRTRSHHRAHDGRGERALASGRPFAQSGGALSSALIGLAVFVTTGVFLEPNHVPAVGHGPPSSLQPRVATEDSIDRRPATCGSTGAQQGPGPSAHRRRSGQAEPSRHLWQDWQARLSKAIEQAGIPKNEAYRAYGALKETLDLDHCRPKDSFRALVTGRRE